MLTIRRNDDIHKDEAGSYTGRRHFSFGNYHDPEWSGIGPLRALNDDRLLAGADSPMQEHSDVEVITYVVEGVYEHEDSVGGGGALKPGGVQRMTAGSGASFGERNGSIAEPMRFVQVWLTPNRTGLEPGLEQRQYDESDRTDQLLEIAAPHGGDALTLHADARIYVCRLHHGNTVEHGIGEGRGAYVYLLEGAVTVDEDELTTGDAAFAHDQGALLVTARETSELVIVDVPLEDAPAPS